MSDVLPITKIPRHGLPPRALVVGDPDRATAVAESLVDSALVGQNREYRTYTGTWKGVPVVVSSHGVGGPGALCQFGELAEAGVRTFLRLGTAGSLAEGITDGDLVIAEDDVRDDGVTQQLIHPEYPAFATPEVVVALSREAPDAHRGVVWTRAAFSPLVLTLPMAEYLAARVIAIEMELSTLLVFAALRGLRAGGVLVIDGDARPEHPDPSAYDPHRDVVAAGVARATRVALDALIEVEGAE
ncbi:purine-nucleoside phosphorylase [Amycolatopsis sp. WAC 01376]|uniref:nucleoside phosphorylase n=1 Tax=Amycolatopsis sp. WAC 01376 TaxID=2203195 RepID=UPI000F7AF06E|nr:nucleoside phosphorylase [Amycolatopsis sp. WAC 01376]RSM61240.1 purine-nucleoside phosphorylase [Amycolatopsis sp. WAC 01376]